jgi:hypothetical protein
MSKHIGISIPLGERQMSEIILKREWQRVGKFDQRIFPVLQHGLH